MAEEKKQFLDKVGVQYLWDKINEYFSQIGHRHETSDVNGLDEYMEENARAIKDTKKVVEELLELPLYPTEEQLGIIYEYDGKLYRGKELPKLILDFSQIEDDGEGNVTQEIIRDFINKNGLNIVTDIDFHCGTYEKYNNGLYINSNLYFQFEERNSSEEFNYWNNIYAKSIKITAQSPYNAENEETYQGCIEYSFDDLGGLSIDNKWWLTNNYPPSAENNTFNFGIGGDINLADYASLYTSNEGCPFTLLKLELELVTCNNEDEYNSGIFHDLLVWEEVSEEELPIEDTTPATEDTRKRFYRETENNNIYVTDTEYNPGEGGFIIDIVHPKTGGQIDDTDELREYIDPNQIWTNGVNGVEQIYADNRYWLNDLGERITITPIRMGTNKSSAYIYLSTKTDVDLYFSPYISMSYPSQEVVIEQNYTTIEVDNVDAGETNEYEVEIFDDINLLNEKWTIVHVPASQEVYVNTSRRCYLHKIVKKGEGEGDRYYWSQIAKIQDIEDRINALPEVARTGSYTDLFNKPCIGDVQVYDWPSDEELPSIDGGTGKCDNRLKQLMRWNDSLYTAVLNDSGLTVDMVIYSNLYNTPGYCGNTLRTYIFDERIEAVRGAYKDYFLTGNTILIQNTKGVGMQLGSTNSYGEMRLSMRTKEDNQRYLFNSIEVGLQSWSSDGEMTTDDGNVYVEVGTTTYMERDFESDLMLIVDSDWNGEWSICKKNLDNLTYDELQAILNTSGNTIVINGNTYQINDYWTTYNENRDLYYCGVSLDTTDNLDHDWAHNEWYNDNGYDISFRGIEQVLTPQQTKNVWFKRYSGEYVYEWVETVFTADCYVGDTYIFAKIGGPSDEEVSNFVNSLNQGDKLKINGIILTVNRAEGNYGIVFDYVDNFQEGMYTIYKLERTLINNPLLRETVSLQGTNCDYLKIWTDEIGEQYGRRCVVRSITFNDLKYEYDPRPEYNRIITRRDYWKQISGSGNGSIKVIDLTGDE